MAELAGLRYAARAAAARKRMSLRKLFVPDVMSTATFRRRAIKHCLDLEEKGDTNPDAMCDYQPLRRNAKHILLFHRRKAFAKNNQGKLFLLARSEKQHAKFAKQTRQQRIKNFVEKQIRRKRGNNVVVLPTYIARPRQAVP
jgi:hypothetical protein